MLLFSKPTARLMRTLTPLALATLAQAQVVIHCDKPELNSRESCTLTVSPSDGVPREWIWRVLGFGVGETSGLLKSMDGNRAQFQLPEAFADHAYTVQVQAKEDPNLAGTIVIRTKRVTQSGVRFLTEKLFPDAFTPVLGPFPSRIPEAFGYCQNMAFCSDPAMGPWDRCWIMACSQGLIAFKVNGDPVPFPKEMTRSEVFSFGAVATLPPGPREPTKDTPRLVFIRANLGEWVGELMALEPDGSLRILATDEPGNRWRVPPRTFRDTTRLVLDREGNTFVLCHFDDGGQLLKFDPKGEWKEWCRIPGGGDAMTLDPSTGEVYIATVFGLIKVTAQSEWTHLIGGGAGKADDALDSKGETVDLPLGRIPKATRFWCDFKGLALHGRELLLVGKGGIHAFHLDTRRHVRLLPGDPVAPATRFGPVPWLNPHLEQGQCALLGGGFWNHIATTQDGLCLLAIDWHSFANLDLPDSPFTAVMDFKFGAPQEVGADRPAAPAAPALESKAGAPVLGPGDSLWLDPDHAAVTVAVNGEGGVFQWRETQTDRRFSGQCRLKPEGFSQGWAQINMQFTDREGKVLAYGQAVGPALPHEVQAPVRDRTLLQVTGTAPEGTDRVMFYVQVRGGAPGETVAFEDVIFHNLP